MPKSGGKLYMVTSNSSVVLGNFPVSSIVAQQESLMPKKSLQKWKRDHEFRKKFQ